MKWTRWRNKGRALLMMRNYEQALSVFDQSIGMDSTVARYHSDRGRALASLNRSGGGGGRLR